MKKIIAFVSGAALLSPLLAFAQTPIRDINGISDKATSIGGLILTLTISVAVIWIVINVVRYLIAGGEEERKKGGMAILFGVIALFVILSIWGLVNILKTSFATDGSSVQSQLPSIGKPGTGPSNLIPSPEKVY